MKLIHIAFGVVAASLLPTAAADEPAAKGKPFTVSFASDVAPVSQAELRYPAYAGARELSGACDVTFDISAAGAAQAVDVSGCSAHIFHSAAKRTVKAMTFAPKAQTGVRMKIRWTMDESAPAMKTASLN